MRITTRGATAPAWTAKAASNWAENSTSLDAASDARRRAKFDGWVYKRGVGDLCPACQERLRDA